MSHVTTRRRRDRHLIRGMRAITGDMWAQFCETFNELPLRRRIVIALRVALGSLK